MRTERGAWLCRTTTPSSPPILQLGGVRVAVLAGVRSRHPQISRARNRLLKAFLPSPHGGEIMGWRWSKAPATPPHDDDGYHSLSGRPRSSLLALRCRREQAPWPRFMYVLGYVHMLQYTWRQREAMYRPPRWIGARQKAAVAGPGT